MHFILLQSIQTYSGTPLIHRSDGYPGPLLGSKVDWLLQMHYAVPPFSIYIYGVVLVMAQD